MTNSSIFPASTHRIVQGTIVDLAGVIRAKNVPAERLNTFAKNGVGAPKVWVVFNADNNFAENEIFNVTGDLRLRLDASQVRPLDEHILWGPTNLVEQNGDPIEYDARNTLRNVVNKAAELGYTAKFGHEFEFLLLPEETALERNPNIFKTPWPGYGAVPFIGQEEFFSDLIAAAGAAGITLEQLHTEWGPYQYEVSIAPEDPVRAADNVVLLKLLLKRVAARHGLTAVLSPKPFVDQTGNGGHVHLSLNRVDDGSPILSGGGLQYGLSEDGAHAIAGVHRHLAELTALLAGSPVSLLRLQPDTWSGAAIGWGLENRETAIRYIAATLGNPHGANIEIKAGDLATNPYVEIAGLLAGALDGIRNRLPLAKPTEGIPSEYDEEERCERGLSLFPATFDAVTKAFEESAVLREFLGNGLVDAITAIRNLNSETYKDTPDEELVYLFRNIW